MDGFVTLGRALVNISFALSVLLAIFFIAFGTYSIVENERPESKAGKEKLPSNLQAGLMIGFGALLIPGAWRFRNKVLVDDRYATLAGFLDAKSIFHMFFKN